MTTTKPKSDAMLESLGQALIEYRKSHPGSSAKHYRYNPGSIRIRIIDDRFGPMSKSKRHDLVWDFLESRVGVDAMGDVSLLLLLSKAEAKSSLMNVEFEDPTPSRV